MRLLKCLCLVATALALPPDVGAAAPAAEQTLRIWPASPPGPSDWPTQEVFRKSRLPDGRTRREYGDVADPAITVIRPDSGRSNGTGIVVLPGGAFMALAWDKEGIEPARWLAKLGYTVFVLKYRVRQLPFPSDQELGEQPGAFDKAMKFLDPNVRVAIMDAQQAIRFVRKNAAGFGVEPNRIGMMGFSAGGTTTMDVVLEADVKSRPDFAASIYGAMENFPVPTDAPPVFLVAAQDDDVVPVEQSVAIFNAWRRAKFPAEIHLYQNGGHGFGLGKPGTPVANWTTALKAWLEEVVLKNPAKSSVTPP